MRTCSLPTANIFLFTTYQGHKYCSREFLETFTLGMIFSSLLRLVFVLDCLWPYIVLYKNFLAEVKGR